MNSIRMLVIFSGSHLDRSIYISYFRSPSSLIHIIRHYSISFVIITYHYLVRTIWIVSFNLCIYTDDKFDYNLTKNNKWIIHNSFPIENFVFGMICSLWYVVYDLWSMICGLWSVVYDMRSMICGLWSVVSDMWSMICGL